MSRANHDTAYLQEDRRAPDPQFSVIIAVYNGAATIERALDSVLQQTYPAQEIIVLDDGSTDETAALIQRYGAQVRYVRQANQGVSAARNHAVNLATSEWLAFLDADDWYYPQRLALHAEWIRRDPALDFLTGDFDYVDPQGDLIGRSLARSSAGQQLLAANPGQRQVVMDGAMLGYFVAQHFGDTHTLSLPRRTFLELGGYPSEFAVCEDVNLLIRLCAISQRVGVITEPMAAYYIHPDSATRRDPLRAQRQTLAALQALKSQLESAPQVVKRGLLGAIRHARLDLATCLLREGNQLQALAAVAPLVALQPGWSSVRDLLSVARGLPK